MSKETFHDAITAIYAQISGDKRTLAKIQEQVAFIPSIEARIAENEKAIKLLEGAFDPK